jgi:predicted Zn-dependent peptidase
VTRLDNLPADDGDTFVSRIKNVTAAHVRAVAHRYLSAERLPIVAVGDASGIADGRAAAPSCPCVRLLVTGL